MLALNFLLYYGVFIFCGVVTWLVCLILFNLDLFQ